MRIGVHGSSLEIHWELFFSIRRKLGLFTKRLSYGLHPVIAISRLTLTPRRQSRLSCTSIRKGGEIEALVERLV